MKFSYSRNGESASTISTAKSVLLLLATSSVTHAWRTRQDIEADGGKLRAKPADRSVTATAVGDDDINMVPSQENYEVGRTLTLNKEITFPVIVIKDEIIQFGVNDILEIFLEPELYEDVLQHGCWCARLNPQADQSILGGNRQIDLDGDGDADDGGLDLLCREWIISRQCNKLRGGSCNAETGTVTGDPYTIDFSHASNYTCIDTNDCQLDSCEIDAYYAFEIYNFITDNGITLIEAESGDCKDPNVQVTPQNRECTGTVPDGLEIVIV